MALAATPGIVLSSRDAGEADRICTILTRDFGKTDFSFKGIRKSRRRPISATEPGSVIDIIFYHRQGFTLNTPKEFSLIEDNARFRASAAGIASLLFLVELVDRTTVSGDPQGKLYEFLAAGLSTLAVTPYPEHLLLFFILHLAGRQGILPSLQACQECGHDLSRGGTVREGSLELFCSECRTGGIEITPSMAAALSLYTGKEKFTAIDHGAVDGDDARRLLTLAVQATEHYYSMSLKSFRLLGEL